MAQSRRNSSSPSERSLTDSPPETRPRCPSDTRTDYQRHVLDIPHECNQHKPPKYRQYRPPGFYDPPRPKIPYDPAPRLPPGAQVGAPRSVAGLLMDEPGSNFEDSPRLSYDENPYFKRRGDNQGLPEEASQAYAEQGDSKGKGKAKEVVGLVEGASQKESPKLKRAKPHQRTTRPKPRKALLQLKLMRLQLNKPRIRRKGARQWSRRVRQALSEKLRLLRLKEKALRRRQGHQRSRKRLDSCSKVARLRLAITVGFLLR